MKKIENSPFDPFVKRSFPKLLPYVPQWLNANLISLIGHLGAMLACISLWLSAWSPWMCLAGAFFVFVHWFADTLDGEVARARGPTQLGYYLDHFGDSVAVVFIGLGLFLIPGTHLIIGLAVISLYLLLIINGLIKTEITGVMELPTFGPTEIHLSIVVLLIVQIFTDFGHPLSWFPGLTGDQGSMTAALGLERGLTLVDMFGLITIVIALVMLVVEVTNTVATVRRVDRD